MLSQGNRDFFDRSASSLFGYHRAGRQQLIKEHIVMTPTKKGYGHTTIRMERMKQVDCDSVMHIAGGVHKGIIINKEAASDDEKSLPQLSLEFKVFLKNASSNTHTQESRKLKFWFKDQVSENDQMHSAQDFFKELISPCEFPRDYVGFIKKIMKLMQGSYSNIKKIEVEMKQLENISQPPAQATTSNGILLDVGDIPSKNIQFDLFQSAPHVGNDGQTLADHHEVSMDDTLLENKAELTKEKLLEIIESSYPTPISINELKNTFQSTNKEIQETLEDLISKNLIKSMGNDTYTRITQNDTEVKMVKQMPTVISSQQPTIAIITAQYCEKLAVDAMIENKDTYVRYKTEGESNVYTLGNIGAHRVVSTKLPATGHSRSAMIAAGSTTTRLLGIFQRVEFVFLIGVGGGVTHYTDYSKHVRQGDVVVSTPPGGSPQEFIYIFCEKLKGSPVVGAGGSSNEYEKFNARNWCPPSLSLQTISQQLWNQYVSSPEVSPWENYIKEGLDTLKGQEADFNRPSRETDKLYMSIGDKDLIEVSHPEVPERMVCPRDVGMPVVHFGSVGSGRMMMRDDSSRMEFAHSNGVKCFVTEFDSVVDSICGNRKDNYIFIRGISDYKDGTMKKEWQPFAALVAAAFMKAVICALDPCDDE